MDIQKMLTISTEHITQSTADMLTYDKDTYQHGLCVYDKEEYGWFIPVWDELLKDYDGPDDLLRCIRYALVNGCQWLCLDCDAETVEDLPTYDW